MQQIKPRWVDFYLHIIEKYEDDELNRYFFDLQTAFDAIDKRINDLNKNKEQ